MTADTKPGRLSHRPALDGLRGVAILLVIAVHTAHRLAPGGMVGVDLFFVISGFLITCLLLDELDGRARLDLRRFYLRRFFRLYPAMLAMLAFAAVWEAFHFPASTPTHTAGDLVPALTYSMNVLRSAGHTERGLVGHTWSLATEEQFYLLWPVALLGLLAAGGRRLAFTACVAGALLESALRFAYWHLDGSVPTTLPWLRSDGVLVGCALAIAWKSGYLRRVPNCLAIVAAVCLALVTRMTSANLIYLAGVPLAVYASAVLVLWATQTSSGLLSWPALRRVGERSYAMYLWHYPIWIALSPIPPGITWPDAWAIVWVLPLTWGAAELSWRLIECPAASLRDKAVVALVDKRNAPRSPQPLAQS